MTGSEDGAEGGDLGGWSDAVDPWQGLAEAEARRALDVYPTLLFVRVEFTCLEEIDGRWRILSTQTDTPQQARDQLAHHLLVFAAESGDAARREEFDAAVPLLTRGRRDELTVARRRFRVGRIERSARLGPDGPEPPRETDTEAPPARVVSEKHTGTPRRSLGFIDANALTGTAAAITRYQLRSKIPDPDTPEACRDALRALHTHPRIVLLPAEFVAAEEIDGRWRPYVPFSEVTPQAARGSLARDFRLVIPGPDSPDPMYARMLTAFGYDSPGAAVCEEYAKAADLLDCERLNDIRVAGRHFRTIRVEQLLRLGRDGPEPPRPSDDHSHQPPAPA